MRPHVRYSGSNFESMVREKERNPANVRDAIEAFLTFLPQPPAELITRLGFT